MTRLLKKLLGPNLLSYWGNRVVTFYNNKYCNDIKLPWVALDSKFERGLEYCNILPLKFSQAYTIQRKLWREKLGKKRM